MKKYLIIAVIVIGIVLTGYFSMWFFLCQTAALEISAILKPQFAVVDDAGRLMEMNRLVVAKSEKKARSAPQDKYRQNLHRVLVRSERALAEVASDSAAFHLVLLGSWSDLIDQALEKADYAQFSVPLGAMKPLLSGWEKAWNAFKDGPYMVSFPDEKDRLLRKSWIYHSLLEGKNKALAGFLGSGDPDRILLALDDIEKNSYKDMRYLVQALFSSSEDGEIRMKAVRVLMVIGGTKDQGVRDYIASVLARQDASVTPEFIDMVANLKTREFLGPLSGLTNSRDSVVRDAALNAFSRMDSLAK